MISQFKVSKSCMAPPIIPSKRVCVSQQFSADWKSIGYCVCQFCLWQLNERNAFPLFPLVVPEKLISRVRFVIFIRQGESDARFLTGLYASALVPNTVSIKTIVCHQVGPELSYHSTKRVYRWPSPPPRAGGPRSRAINESYLFKNATPGRINKCAPLVPQRPITGACRCCHVVVVVSHLYHVIVSTICVRACLCSCLCVGHTNRSCPNFIK